MLYHGLTSDSKGTINQQEVAAAIPKSALPKDPDAVVALKNLKERVQSGIQKYTGAATTVRPQRLPHTNDFARLARRLCGKSIGLVLGGGGARGISHLVRNCGRRLSSVPSPNPSKLLARD